jgi:hypothetical protein
MRRLDTSYTAGAHWVTNAMSDASHSPTASGPTRRADSRRRSAGGRPRSTAPAPRGGRDLFAGGTEGNERLTVQTGALLFVLLAVLGVTIVRIGQLLWLHLFLGLLLIGPVVLKLASTGYRFLRYYTADPAYSRKGPPPQLLRLLAPLLALSTVAVFATGVALLAIGPSSRDMLLLWHKVSFFVWLAVAVLHMVGHLPELRRGVFGGRLLRAEVFAAAGADGRYDRAWDLGGAGIDRAGLPPAGGEPGGRGRALSIGLALLAGAILAVALLPDFGPWTQFHHIHHVLGDH